MLKASLAVKVAAGAVGVLLAGGGIAFAANSLSNGNEDPGATNPTPGASCQADDEGHGRDEDHEGDGGREGDGHEAPLAVHPNGSGEADDDADSHEADEHDADEHDADEQDADEPDADEPDADDDAQGEDCDDIDDIDDIDESHMSEGPETEESEGPDSDHNSGGGSQGDEATPAPSVSHTGSDD